MSGQYHHWQYMFLPYSLLVNGHNDGKFSHDELRRHSLKICKIPEIDWRLNFLSSSIIDVIVN